MSKSVLRGSARPGRKHSGRAVRTGLVLLAAMGIVVAWTFMSPFSALAAAKVVETPTQTNPWGVAFDSKGHVWVAEPGCDVSPMCGTAFQSYIGEYNRSNNTLVQNFFEPKGYSSPVFVVVDKSGNIWFTETNSNAIGELIPGTTPKWTQWKVPTADSLPYDLTMDKNGNIWFTEYKGNKIGFFNTSTHAFVENTIPTAASDPYGITKAASGKIWFAENAAPKIGSFTPTTTGKVTIAEHMFSTVTSNPPTAHLITSDHHGNIWYSEGFAGQIGEWIPSTGVYKQFTVTKASSNHISGISVDSKNRIWFDDSLNAVVGYYDPATGAIKTVTLSNLNAHPHDGLKVDSNDNTWFTEQYGNKLGEVLAGSL